MLIFCYQSAAEARTRKLPIQGPQETFFDGDCEIEDAAVAATAKKEAPRSRAGVLKGMKT